MTLKPPRIKEGSTIGIVAPASPYYGNMLEKCIETFETFGFNVVVGETVYDKQGYLAGNDNKRAQDLNGFFKDKYIDGIICLRGGYGSLRLLDKIDYNAIKHNPKVFIGYSDITALHISINKLCNMVTFHGPVITNFTEDMDNYTKSSFLQAVTSATAAGILTSSDNSNELHILSPGEARGEIIGGNLTIITATLGTPYEIETTGKILFLEDVGEYPYRIDRMLTQLILCNKLQKCAGIVLGQWTGCEPKHPEESLSLFEVFEDRLQPLGIPILYNLAAGHGKTKMTIPLNTKTKITNDGKLVFEEGGVI
jgi:muramoyltetrapeptide carboxypeptidase